TGAFLSAYGFAAEDEEAEFKPHITIGRARGTLQTPDINGIHALMRSKPVKAVLTDLQYDWRVGEVHLYRSHLATEGATYEILATAKLG
ncbi:MAG TPA: hypothetical protein PK691_10770, partial [Thermomicrobiales bacterium]|nr:hypothetical protein [Thermomicrobiales bacterium]